MQEVWKDIYYVDSISGKIVDYRNLYQVSSYGRVRRIDRITRNKRRILNLGLRKDGYCYVNLSANGIVKNYYVHRLVASVFLDNPENKPHVDHINTIRTDNRAENLRFVTQKENCNNPSTIKNKSIAVVAYINDEIINIYDSVLSASKITGFKQTNIYTCCNKKLKSCGKINGNKVKWKYLTDVPDDDLIKYLIKQIIKNY